MSELIKLTVGSKSVSLTDEQIDSAKEKVDNAIANTKKVGKSIFGRIKAAGQALTAEPK